MASSADKTLGHTLAGCVDAFKGILILVVVMDHNDVAHGLFPATFRPLTFHVLGFLLLPFLVSHPPLSWPFVRDRFVRYWVPFVAIMSMSSVLFWLGYHRGESVSRIALDYLLAITIGSAPLVKTASGFLAYWFLPALVGMVVLLGVYDSASTALRRLMFLVFAAAHLALVVSNFGAYYWVPFGLAIVANVFVLGLILRALCRSTKVFRGALLFPIAFVLSYGWLVHRNSWLEVMTLQLAPASNPSMFMAQDLAAISGIVTVLLLANWLRDNRHLGSIGRHSLAIYLLHPLVYVAAGIALHGVGLEPTSVGVAVIFGLITYVAAVLVSWGSATLLAHSPRVSTWITPRDWMQWAPVAAMNSVKVSRT